MWKDFKAFISKGNVIDLAVAVVIGAAFGKIVTSFVEDVLMPPIGLLLGGVDFSDLFVVLDRSKGIPASVAQAKAQGIPVLAYGAFINTAINFLIIAFAVFLLVRAINKMQALRGGATPPAPTEKPCPYCLTNVPIKATRCAHCTSELK